MKTRSEQLLVNAAGQLMHDHAFDHLSDEKLNRIRQSFKRLSLISFFVNLPFSIANI
ncbi:MAG: hypothetical protein KGL19_05145 [Bacteroidota bacterium]|nr:hypothetical protein [Bacteroidota bacterium]